MTGSALGEASRCRMAWWLAAAIVLSIVPATATRAAESDLFQEAVNFVFTGRIDPPDGPEIVDRKGCVVVVPDPTNKRYARYHLGRFKMDSARYDKRYSGTTPLYDLDVQGDDIILEYLAPDKTTVKQAYKTAQISLPGNFDQTQKALQIIAQSCKTESPKAPF
jgi:hypothetical protein